MCGCWNKRRTDLLCTEAKITKYPTDVMVRKTIKKSPNALCALCVHFAFQRLLSRSNMAERVGFEPTSELPRYSISSAAPSASSDTAPRLS